MLEKFFPEMSFNHFLHCKTLWEQRSLKKVFHFFFTILSIHLLELLHYSSAPLDFKVVLFLNTMYVVH